MGFAHLTSVGQARHYLSVRPEGPSEVLVIGAELRPGGISNKQAIELSEWVPRSFPDVHVLLCLNGSPKSPRLFGDRTFALDLRGSESKVLWLLDRIWSEVVGDWHVHGAGAHARAADARDGAEVLRAEDRARAKGVNLNTNEAGEAIFQRLAA